jgi:hypothetical protein
LLAQSLSADLQNIGILVAAASAIFLQFAPILSVAAPMKERPSELRETDSTKGDWTMPKLTTYSDHLNHWQVLLTALEENEASLPQLTLSRDKLQALLTQALARVNTQAVHTAAKQEASSELVTLIDQGSKLATLLRNGVREHYGNRSEKLAEFRMQPFRGRNKGVVPPPEPPEAPVPTE